MKCPGQDTRYWKPGDIFEVECPHCGKPVEFFKDETTRRCRGCKKSVLNPRMDFGCAAYCRFAATCLGELGPELLSKRNDLLKDRVAHEVKRRLGRDFRTLAHTIKVARRVEEIAREEKAAPVAALCAAYLHSLFETTGRETGQAKPAREILEGLGADRDIVDAVLDVIARFQKGDAGNSIDARIFFDAHLRALEDDDEPTGPIRSGNDPDDDASGSA